MVAIHNGSSREPFNPRPSTSFTGHFPSDISFPWYALKKWSLRCINLTPSELTERCETFRAPVVPLALKRASKNIRTLFLDGPDIPSPTHLLKSYPSVFSKLIHFEWVFPRISPEISRNETRCSLSHLSSFFKRERFPSLRIFKISYVFVSNEAVYALINSILCNIPSLLGFCFRGVSIKRLQCYDPKMGEYVISMPKNLQFIHLDALPPMIKVDMSKSENLIVFRVGSAGNLISQDFLASLAHKINWKKN